MSIKFFLRRGTAAEHSSFTGDAGEVTLDTTNNRVIVHDGTTVGGIPMAHLSDVAAATTLAGLSDVTITTPSNTHVLRYSSGVWVNGALAIADITSLQSTLNGKAATSHTHTTANITDLASYTGLDARYYTESETDTLLAGKSDTSHNHTGVYEPADATILKDADIGVTVAAQSHTHDYAASSHTHASTAITDFEEAVEDVMGAAIVAGTGIGVSYDDAAGTITVSYTGGGGGGATSLDGLSDVTLTTPTTAQVLRYNGTLFVNATLVIGDVSGLQTALDGKSSTSHDHAGVYATAGHAHAINDLSDVTITTPSNGQVLKYNGSAWVNGTDSTGAGGGSVSSARLAFFGSF